MTYSNNALEDQARSQSPVDLPEAIFASILIPTFRRPHLVCRVLAKCLEQIGEVGEKIEIVVVDNCPDRSSEAVIKQRFSDSVRYIHEPRTGFSSVRNCALRNARGRFVIFLDDDQYPEPGWLSAFVDVAKGGASAAFGPIAPEYDVVPKNYKAILDRIFTREFPVDGGDDISRYYPYLSTGNCMFEKARCFPGESAFDMRFNKLGGEDVWLFKGLCAQNIPLTWAAGARAIETVPASRINFEWLVRRRFRSGQIRSLLVFHPNKRRPLALLFWMGAGAVQAVSYGGLSLLTSLFSRERAKNFLIKAAGGAGKVFWFETWRHI